MERPLQQVTRAGATDTPRAIHLRSPLRYPGGKQKAIARISPLLPKKVLEYREPMVGGGSVYLHAKEKEIAQRYWINDKFRDLIAFWKTVQDPETCSQMRQDLEELLNGFISAAQIKEFYLTQRNKRPSTRYEIAMRFFFFNRVSFSGTTQAGGFSSAASVLRFTQSSIDRLAPLPCAMSDTRITNYDFRKVIEADGDDVFIFLDPPYFTADKLYGRNGSLHQFPHRDLSELLQQTKHRFLITYDDCPQIRKLYGWANIKVTEWNLTYGMNNCNRSNTCKVGAELFISNY